MGYTGSSVIEDLRQNAKFVSRYRQVCRSRARVHDVTITKEAQGTIALANSAIPIVQSKSSGHFYDGFFGFHVISIRNEKDDANHPLRSE